jgi:hypothetical protein
MARVSLWTIHERERLIVVNDRPGCIIIAEIDLPTSGDSNVVQHNAKGVVAFGDGIV